MITATRLARTMAFCGLGLLLPLLAHGQSPPAAPSPGDTVSTTVHTALWTSAEAVTLKAALPPGTQLFVEQVQEQRLRVRSTHGTGWVSRSALNAGRTVVRHSASGAGRGATAARPSWRLSLRPSRRSALAVPQLALREARRGGALVSVVLSNHSRHRTAKAVRLGLVLYDRAPDSTAQHVRPRTVRALGPLAPRSLAAYDFRIPETARHDCVGVRWARAEYLDGSTMTSTPGQGLPYPGDHCRPERPPDSSGASR